MKLLALSVTVFVVFAIFASAQADYKVICYYNSTSWDRTSRGIFTPSNVNTSLCTHIVYAYAILDNDTLTIQPQNSTNDVDNGYYDDVTAFRSNGVNVSIGLGGWNDSLADKYSRLLTNSTARAAFIDSVVEFIQTYNFSGLDLDLRYPSCWQGVCSSDSTDKDGFSQLIQELSSAFSSEGYELSAAVSANVTIIDAAYDIPTLSDYLDWITLMTFDYHAFWLPTGTGYGAPLYSYTEDTSNYTNVNYTVNYWIDGGANSSKLIVGIPAYGRSYTLSNTSENGLAAATDGAGTAGQYVLIEGLLSFAEILYRTKLVGYSVVRDPGNATGLYSYVPGGSQWFSYEDVNTVRIKANYIVDNSLGGGMMFTIDLDDFSNTRACGYYPLLTSLNQVLRNTGGTVKSTCI